MITCEEIQVYEYLNKGSETTSSIPTGVAVIKDKKGKVLYFIVPEGYDYECDGGHGVNIIKTEEEFLKYFSYKEVYPGHVKFTRLGS